MIIFVLSTSSSSSMQEATGYRCRKRKEILQRNIVKGRFGPTIDKWNSTFLVQIN